MDNLLSEVSALKRTIESKSAAIVILRTELQECQQARDKFRFLAEQQPLSRSQFPYKLMSCAEGTGSALRGSASALADILSQTKEENKRLRQEINEIRCRLHDAYSDLKVLRDEKIRHTGNGKCRSIYFPSGQLAEQERQDLIEQLESVSVRSGHLEKDIRGLLEEKEELVSEREVMKGKFHRLNYILNVRLSTEEHPSPIVDLDSLISENRYLRQRLKKIQEDEDMKISVQNNHKLLGQKQRFYNKSKTMYFGDGIFSDKQDGNNFIKGDNNFNMKTLRNKFVDTLNQKCEIIDSLKKANGILVKHLEECQTRSIQDSNIEHAAPKLCISESATETLMADYNPHN